MMSPLNFLWVFLAIALQAHCALNIDQAEDSFKECLVSRAPGSLGYCLGFGALSKLQSFDNSPEFNLVDGLSFARDEKMYRDGFSGVAEGDPNSFRSIIDSVGQVFSRRSMRWDMDFLYPGLAMRVAPSANVGGVLEFVMDPHRDAAFGQHSLKEAGTGRILARQFLVPLLVGFKFNMATLIPILFGLLALIAKKAVVLSKLALVISSAFSISSLLFNSAGPSHGFGYQPTYNPSFGGLGGHGGHGAHYAYRVPADDEYQDSTYRGNANAEEYTQADQLRLYDGQLQQAFSRDDKKEGRNFAWNEAEKTNKKA